MRAHLNLRHGAGKLHRAFAGALEGLGYEVVEGLTDTPAKCDLLVTWNLPADARAVAKRFSKVFVVENASWGNDFCGKKWRHIAIGRHNTSGCFPVGGPERWDVLGVNLAPWRPSGTTLVLAQRGIGPPGVAMPQDWVSRHRDLLVRLHPGRTDNPEPLEHALRGVERVITWSSGAAIKALMMGCKVQSDMPNWIGEQDNTDAGRLAMFRRLAWAQWTLDEIAEGVPLRRYLA